jgi:hypothetical protein
VKLNEAREILQYEKETKPIGDEYFAGQKTVAPDTKNTTAQK